MIDRNCFIMYILLDMGTSNTRLWLCDEKHIIASARGSFGAGTTKHMGKSHLFEELKKSIEMLLVDNNVTTDSVKYILTSGMAGSELGLCEIPHISLPESIYSLVLVRRLKIHICPFHELSTIFIRLL